MFSIWLVKVTILSARIPETPSDGRIAKPLSGPARSGAEQQVDVAVGDLGRVQPPARAVPLRRVVDHPEQGAAWRGVRASRKAFERLVEDALERAGAGSATDPRLALSALLGMVNHTAQWYRPRGRLSATEIADGYVDLLLGG